MSKLTDLYKKVADIHARKTEREEELARLREEREIHKETMAAAAEADDWNTYTTYNRAIDNDNRRISFLEASISHLPDAVTTEEVHAAWDEYAKEHNKELAKKLAAYNDARVKLCNQFLDLVKLQNNALKTRAELAQTVSADVAHFEGLDFIPVRDIKDKAFRRISVGSCYDAALIFAQLLTLGCDGDNIREIDGILFNILERHIADKIDNVRR